MISLEVLGKWVAFALTLIVFSYLIKDNFLYRLALHILIGVTAGYAFLVTYVTIIEQKLLLPLLQDPQGNISLLVPFILGVLLLTKLLPRMGWLGNVSLAFLFGVGAALAIGGAVAGTLWPQVRASILPLNPAQTGVGKALNNFIILVGTLSTLFYFYFTGTRKRKLLRAWASLGRTFIMIALGALFATGFVTFVTLLISRVKFLLEAVGW